MWVSRRHFLQGASAAAILAATPADALLHGSNAGALSQRSVINIGAISDNSYPFINFFLAGDGNNSPIGSAFSTGTPFPALIDANGWPNQPGVSGTSFGGSVRIPGSDEYTGKWVLTWDGDGRVFLNGGTWTVDAASSSNYVQNANGIYSNATFGVGSSPRVVVTLTGSAGPSLIPLSFTLTDPNSVGAYLKNFKFYQLSDETDLLAGKIFRANFKQPLVNLNPSVLRFLNYYGGNATRECRFENRTLPTNASYSNFGNWVSSPSYPAATGTNLYSVGVAVPTTANPKNTPASLTHGEIALVRFTNAAVRSNGQYSISAIANGPNAQVTTSAAHGLNTGDTAIHFSMVGMSKLNYFPVVVTVVDATHYTIPVDTTSYGAFTSGLGTQYWSINVGARGARPLCWVTGFQPASVFGNFISAAGSYAMLVYDKNIQIQSDGAGNMIAGAWTFDGAGSSGSRADMPLEVMTALVNEVNALSVSQGINTPINMWINCPHTGLTSMDPDYTTASDWSINAADVILNQSSIQRTGGYSALTSTAKLFVEYSNETWNSAGGFWAYFYLNRMGALRWPSSGANDDVDMYVLRSTIVMRAISASWSSRIKRVLSGQGILGFTVGDLNEARCDGSSTPGAAGNYYTTDTIVTSGGFGTPISNHDAFATATYFDPDATYSTGQFVTDSATYALGGSTNQNTAIASFVANVVSGAGQSINGYLNNSLSGLTASYAAAMVTRGKTAINYEGGTDWPTNVGASLQGHTITSADSTFLIAVIDSTQWRDAQVGYLNRTSQLAGSAMPAVYLFVSDGAHGQQWSYTIPDSFGGTATEGQGLLNNPTWVGMGARNQALS